MTRVLVLLLFCCLGAHAADWPQVLGPTRNGLSADKDIPAAWSKEGPRVLWRSKVGQGWSGPILFSNQVYIFHRAGDEETLECLDEQTGAAKWKGSYPSGYRDDFGFDEGPRATPWTDGRTVVTYGANGMLTGWKAIEGRKFWQVDTRKEFKSDKGFFGIAASPLVENGAVIVNFGGKDAGIVAFNLTDGKVRWKSTSEEASYSSPVAATMGGKRRVLVLARRALVTLDPEQGRVLWQHPFTPSVSASVSAAAPLVIGDQIFLSASYGAGAVLLRYVESAPQVVWEKDDVLSSHYTTSVFHDGFLYGFDGRQEQRCHLRCVELATGKVRWSEEHFGAGHLIIAGNKLLVLTERGELMAAAASAEKFKPLARAQIVGSDVRAIPALANGLFLARDKRELVCVDLR